jgi:hypothetical protein
MVTVSPEPTVVDGKNMYEAGQKVVLTANQYEGLVTFTNWNDGTTNSEKTVTMDANQDITASYSQADIIAGWDFYKAGGNGRKADFAAQDNDADALNLVNTETGETQGWLDKSTVVGGGYESFKGAAVNWRTGAENGDVGNWHWQTKINAEAFTDIKVQFQMLYNYNAYQKYNVEYSLNGTDWTNFGSITMEGAKNAASFSEKMPEACNNQTELYIRMNIELSAIILHFYYTGLALLPYGSQPTDTVVAYSARSRFNIIFLLHVLCCHAFEFTCATRCPASGNQSTSGKNKKYQFYKFIHDFSSRQ